MIFFKIKLKFQLISNSYNQFCFPDLNLSRIELILLSRTAMVSVLLDASNATLALKFAECYFFILYLFSYISSLSKKYDKSSGLNYRVHFLSPNADNLRNKRKNSFQIFFHQTIALLLLLLLPLNYIM